MFLKFPKFLSIDECTYIKKIMLDKEKEILKLPKESDFYDGTTARFMEYNFLNYIPEINLPSKLFTLAFLEDLQELWIQSWANILHKNQELPLHQHSEKINFIVGNIFIDGESNTTYYENVGYVKNEIGDLCLIDSSLKHSVPKNMCNDCRLSIAFDLHENNPTQFKNYKQRIVHAKKSI